MDKPEDYKSAPRQIREEATLLINSFGHDLSLLEGAIAAAILSAQSQAYIDAAKIARLKSGDAQAIANRLRDFFDEPGHSRRLALDAAMMIEYLNSDRISAAILQRKEEIGR